jgi:hypothetical protein
MRRFEAAGDGEQTSDDSESDHEETLPRRTMSAPIPHSRLVPLRPLPVNCNEAGADDDEPLEKESDPDDSK